MSTPRPIAPTPEYRSPSTAEYPATPLSCHQPPPITSITHDGRAERGRDRRRSRACRGAVPLRGRDGGEGRQRGQPHGAESERPGEPPRHHGTSSVTSAAGSARAAAEEGELDRPAKPQRARRGPRGPGPPTTPQQRAVRPRAPAARPTTSERQEDTGDVALGRGPRVAVGQHADRAGQVRRAARAPTGPARRRRAGRSRAGPARASAVGARSNSCTYPARPVLDEVSHPPANPGPSAIATCSRAGASVSARPATMTSERAGRTARTVADRRVDPGQRDGPLRPLADDRAGIHDGQWALGQRRRRVGRQGRDIAVHPPGRTRGGDRGRCADRARAAHRLGQRAGLGPPGQVAVVVDHTRLLDQPAAEAGRAG